jgi:hypothetical protein
MNCLPVRFATRDQVDEFDGRARTRARGAGLVCRRRPGCEGQQQDGGKYCR